MSKAEKLTTGEAILAVDGLVLYVCERIGLEKTILFLADLLKATTIQQAWTNERALILQYEHELVATATSMYVGILEILPHARITLLAETSLDNQRPSLLL
jgi:hypothetical protein